MRFERGDIVLSAPGWSAGITEVDPLRPKNAYNGLNLVNRKTYRLSDASLSQKVGTATEEFLNGGSDDSPGEDPASTDWPRDARDIILEWLASI
jgi:hypothetical protein